MLFKHLSQHCMSMTVAKAVCYKEILILICLHGQINDIIHINHVPPSVYYPFCNPKM